MVFKIPRAVIRSGFFRVVGGCLLLGICLLLISPQAQADFTILSGQNAGSQTLFASGTGTIQSGGTVSTNSMFQYGIRLNGSQARVINHGTISAGVSALDSIYLGAGATGSQISNHGTIVNTTTTGYGIFSTANDVTLYNNGSIVMDVASDSAITMSGLRNILILGPQSDIQGVVHFQGAGGILQYETDISFPAEGGGFAVLGRTPPLPQIIGTYTTQVTGQMPTLMVKDSVIVSNAGQSLAVTPDIFVSTNQSVTQSTQHTANILDQRQQVAFLGKNHTIHSGTQYAADGASLNDMSPAASGWGIFEKSVAWVEGFAAFKERPAYNASAYQTAKSRGIVAGLDLPENMHGYRTGYYAGTFDGDLTLGKTGFRKIDTSGFLSGGYISKNWGAYQFIGHLMGGAADHDSERRVNQNLAMASYRSYFTAPSVTAMRTITTPDITWVPSVTVRYQGQITESYTERGSSANQTVSETYNQTLTGRLQLDAYLQDIYFSHGFLSPSFRIGLEGQTALGEESVLLNVLNTNVLLDTESEKTVDALFGINLVYDTGTPLSFYVDGEMSIGLKQPDLSDNVGGTARIGMKWLF
ncbi:MAG: autotransporter outer membrane beta-barrel domain-containing protein [Alphaproteobacteria bacterium]|nr:autotransporter outer membrane beta-barrel domain-containing protein [Alphaproteobacteria bacterium]